MPAPHSLLIVLDTNVLVSALLKRSSKPGQVLDLVLSGQVRLALDTRIIQEYREVLVRPKLGIDSSAAEAVLSYFQITGRRINAARFVPEHVQILDPGDLPFVEVALTAKVNALVTGNTRHFEFVDRTRLPVLSPSGFLEYIATMT